MESLVPRIQRMPNSCTACREDSDDCIAALDLQGAFIFMSGNGKRVE